MHNRPILVSLLLMPLLAYAISPGESNSHPTPIKDGQVVLVKLDLSETTSKTILYGAFILEEQTFKPEKAKYKWCVQSDHGKFGSKYVQNRCGEGNTINTNSISFEIFNIGWSINKDGFGWVSYSHYPSEKIRQIAYQMCVTEETNMEDIDPTDPKWIYRSKPPQIENMISNKSLKHETAQSAAP